MTEFKSIICFANSYRDGGRCFAGKDIKTGEWVIPICSGDLHSIPRERQKLSDGTFPKLLEIIKVPIKGEVSEEDLRKAPFQRENWYLDEGRWEKTCECSYDKALQLVEEPEDLWGTGEQSSAGVNDRVHRDGFGRIEQHSLFLLQLSGAEIYTKDRSEYGNPSQTRASFKYKGVDYDLAVTCPETKDRYTGKLPVKTREALVCISLAEPLGNLAYQLVAGMMFPR